MNKEFAAHGAAIAGVYFCPHHPSEGLGAYRRECRCRKPAPGLILDAARDLGIDLGRSVLFGDKPSDLQAAQSAGIAHRVLLGTDGRERPADTSAPGLATARFRSLAEAVGDDDMQALLARLARARSTS
jgi:D-glycero-D-manno-heptose 1,7-bisphosphate phosphatase